MQNSFKIDQDIANRAKVQGIIAEEQAAVERRLRFEYFKTNQ
jgi:hypothetical protein